jgi:hypothetical protein
VSAPTFTPDDSGFMCTYGGEDAWCVDDAVVLVDYETFADWDGFAACARHARDLGWSQSVSATPGADAVTGHPLPAAGSSADASVSSAGIGNPRPVSGHQERKEGER